MKISKYRKSGNLMLKTVTLVRFLKTKNAPKLYCIVLYCIVLYCIVLYCIVLYCIVLYCIANDLMLCLKE